MNPLRSKLEQNLGWIVLLVLLAGCLLVLRPFVSALLWAVVLCFSSWPVYRRCSDWVRNRRTLAALLMTLAMILIVLLPFVIVGTTLADNVNQLTGAAKTWIAKRPARPARLAGPGARRRTPGDGLLARPDGGHRHALDAGAAVHQTGERLAAPGRPGAGRRPPATGVEHLHRVLPVPRRRGRRPVDLTTAVERIGGEQGKHLLTVAGKTVRGVVYGILGTALVQAVVTGIGLLIAGVPGAALLALLTFFASVVPVVGTGLVWIPAALWLFHQGLNRLGHLHAHLGRGRRQPRQLRQAVAHQPGQRHAVHPDFLRRASAARWPSASSASFSGPTLLAVGYRLTQEWIASSRSSSPEPSSSAPPD